MEKNGGCDPDLDFKKTPFGRNDRATREVFRHFICGSWEYFLRKPATYDAVRKRNRTFRDNLT